MTEKIKRHPPAYRRKQNMDEKKESRKDVIQKYQVK